ncbi:MAG: hypothetical protein R2865_10630 [Deinococcales bacterium]
MSEAKAQAAKQVPMPIREARIDKALARERLGLPLNALITFVMGSSQGSVFLNRLVPKSLSRFFRLRLEIRLDISLEISLNILSIQQWQGLGGRS